MEYSLIFLILLALPTIFAQKIKNKYRYKDQCAKTDTCSQECLNRGFIQSQEKNSCDYPSFEYCLDKTKPNCSEEKIACTDLGFQQDDQSEICVAPTHTICMDQYPPPPGKCLDWQYCTYLGYQKFYDVINNCVSPSDCTRASQCENHMTACIELGFSKNGQDNNCICEAPLKEILEDGYRCKTCKSDENICSKTCIEQGWVSIENKCVEPDCLKAQNACGKLKLCSVVYGYVTKSEDDKNCVIPKCNESNKNNCADSNHVCVSQNGFTKKQENNDCECDSKKIIKANKCVKKNIIKIFEKIVENAVETTIEKTCKSEIDKCTEECIAKGWVNFENKCVEPDCLDVKDACDGKKICSVVYGYTAKSEKDKNCVIPECNESNKNNCADSNHVCISQNGFTKKQENSDCECDSQKTIQDNKCVEKKVEKTVEKAVEKTVEKTCKSDTDNCSDNKSTAKTSSIKLYLSSISLLLLILA